MKYAVPHAVFAVVRPAGIAGQRSVTPVSACAITWCQMGAAPVMPVVPCIAESSAFPTQVAVASCGVQPTVKLSLKFSLVPVLAATR